VRSARIQRSSAIGGLVAVASLALALALSASALAAPASVVVDTRTPPLEEGEGGASKIALSFTNITDAPAVLSANAVAQPKCPLSLSTNQLPPAEITPVTVEIPPTCETGDELKIDITAASGTGPLPVFKIDPQGEPAKEPNWDHLAAFAVALVGSLALVLLLFWKSWTPSEGAKRSLGQPLKYIDATWKFNDNWVTNVSAVGALLTGVFGASTVKVFLGEDAESAVALATVGAAIALALVAAGPVILIALKNLKLVKGKGREDAFTAGGLLLAASVVLASAFGQLWVVMVTAMELDLGGTEDYLPLPVALAAILLLVYSWRSLKDILERGTEEPKAAKAVEIRAAETIARAIRAKQAAAMTGLDEEAIAQRIVGATSVGDDPYQERDRSPML
jgi:hypothetical protein